MSLPKFSPKRLKEIADGTRNRDGSKKMTAAEYQAKVAKVKKRRPSRAIAKDRAWEQFSMFIRLRDAGPDGYAKCVTCPRVIHWRDGDAGHFITRAKEATLFDERNVAFQCKGCNRFQGGKPLEHEQAIIRKWGSEVPDQLKTKAVQRCKRTESDYTFIEQTYRLRVENIKANSPEKFQRAA